MQNGFAQTAQIYHGYQLKLFNQDEFIVSTNTVQRGEFLDSFTSFALSVSNVIRYAHEDMLAQWIDYPPLTNQTKSKDLNDRIQRFSKEMLPNISLLGDFETIELNIEDKFRCIYKKLGENGLPSFNNKPTDRAIERFSQYKRKDNNFDIPYITIGYALEPDYQTIREIAAVKTYINTSTMQLNREWFIPFSEMLSNISIQTTSDAMENMQGKKDEKEDFPRLKIKTL
jgi:hypothetical protein